MCRGCCCCCTAGCCSPQSRCAHGSETPSGSTHCSGKGTGLLQTREEMGGKARRVGWGGSRGKRRRERERKGCGLLRSRRTFRLWQHGALTSPRRAQEMPCCSIYVYQIQTSGLHLAQAPSLPTTSTSEELSGPLPFLVQG